MKKLLLLLALIISGVGLNAQSVGQKKRIGDLVFEITNLSPNECMVSECSEEATDVTIPSTVTISGMEFYVTSIREAVFYDHDKLISVSIPDAIKYLPSFYYSYEDDMFDWVEYSGYNGMFESCENLTSVTFGENSKLIEIGIDAFADCSKLINIDIPKTVNSIGGGAFRNSSLKEITIPQDVTCLGVSVETYMEVDDISGPWESSHRYGFFQSCRNLVSVTFEDNSQLTSIGVNAFSGCSSLKSIEIPNSVASISSSAFSGCSSLESVTFEDNSQLTSIEGSIFSKCSSLESIEIPNSVASISSSAFSGCSSLESVTFEDNSQLTSIKDYTFSECSSLVNVEIPNSVTSIGIYAFNGCLSLESITVEEDNPIYDSRNNCNAIIESSTNTLRIGCKSTVIPNSVTYIGASAFSDCKGLTSIGIPNSVIDIATSAFSKCSKLERIYCYAKYVPKTEASAFDGCPSNMLIYVLEDSYGWYLSASPWNNYIIRPLTDVPLNVTTTAIDKNAIKVEWNAVSSVVSYNVYRRYNSRSSDFELIANVKETSYIDTGLEENTKYFYSVTSVNSNGIESEKSETIGATTLNPENVEELSSSFNIYPNPVNDMLFIEAEIEIEEVVVYDTFGRQQTTVNGQQTSSIDVSRLNNGVYLIRIKTNDGVVTKRFVKN